MGAVDELASGCPGVGHCYPKIVVTPVPSSLKRKALVVHACNPSVWKAEPGDHDFEVSL